MHGRRLSIGSALQSSTQIEQIEACADAKGENAR
jgi:hypothetical protein